MAENKSANLCPACALLSLHPEEPHTKRTARVEEILRRNNPPLDVELADFRLVDRAPEILQDLDEKIVLAKETLDNLVWARSQAESHVADAKSLIHPMRSLPYDVLSEIFSHCVPSWAMNERSATSLDLRTAPWTLTRVCFRWRHIALSSPNLWTYIGLDFEELDRQTSRQLLYTLGVFFERSKGLPLSVYICSLEEIYEHPLLSVLEVTIPRWKQLTISIPNLSLRSFSGIIFSSLETLVFIFDADYESESNMDVSVFIPTSVPVLRTFKVDPYFTWDAIDYTDLPWSNFVRVIDLPSDDAEVYNYLETMTKLEELTVFAMNTAVFLRDAPVSLPILLRLTLIESGDPDLKHLQKVFSILDIPSLSGLNLCFRARDHKIHHFPQLQTGTKETLVNLYISCTMTSHTDNVQNLLRFLLDTPCAETFCIVDEAMSVDFISALKVSPALSPLLPCLRKLDISDCFCDNALRENFSVIYDMLESRYAPVMTSTSGTSNVNPMTLLETVRVPRWLYFEKDDRWEDICRNLKVECGITMQDDDSDDEESDNASDDEQSYDDSNDEQSDDDSEDSDSEG